MGREAGGRGAGRPGARLPRPGPRRAAELEIEHHLGELAERLEAEGMPPAEARAEAERRFGDPEIYRTRLERTERRRTTMTWVAVLDFVTNGLKRSARTLRRSPGFAAGVVATLALGIGANAVMFGILDRLLFQPPAHVVDHEEVVRLTVEQPMRGEVFRSPLGSFPDYLDMKEHRGFESVAAWSGAREETLGRGAEAARVRVAQATHELFPLLGVHPAIGRFFGADDDRIGAPPTAVVSEEYWRREMGSDPQVLGRTLVIAGDSYVVIGVAPAGFTGVDLSAVDVWLPLETSQALTAGTQWRGYRGLYWLQVVARLRDGTDRGVAAREATRLHLNGRATFVQNGNYSPDARVELDPLILARGPEATPQAKVARWLGGVSLVVLLIACANVTNLLLARGAQRRREVAVRLALGVDRATLAAEMMLETLFLSLGGGVLAMGLATWGGGIIRSVLLPDVYFPPTGSVPRAVAFTLCGAVAAGLLAGVGPALQATRARVADDLSMGAGTSSRRLSRPRAALTVVQAALSVVLLVGAGLFVRSVSEIRGLDLGLDVDRLLLAQIEFEAGPLPDGAEDTPDAGEETRMRNGVYREAMTRLRTLPGVEAVAATDGPFQYVHGMNLRVPGLDSLPRLGGGGPYFQNVTPGYFRTVGLAITRGRALTDADDANAPRVTVVNETMARTLWPETDAIGQIVLVGEEEEPFEVVGVVEDASRGLIRDQPFMSYYMPALQQPLRPLIGLYMRSSVDPPTLAGSAALALRTLDPRVRFATVRPLRELVEPQARSWRLGATLFTAFGLLAVVVAAIGLYSVLAFEVAERKRELGIRAALGAEKRRLLAQVVADGLRLAGLGISLGLAVAMAAAPLIRDLLFEVSPRDPAVLASVAGALLVVALVASVAPAVRATRVDPMVALRAE